MAFFKKIPVVVGWVYDNRKPIGILLTSLLTLVGIEKVTTDPVSSVIIDPDPNGGINDQQQ